MTVHPDTPLADPRFEAALQPSVPNWGVVPLVAVSRNGAVESVMQGALAVCDIHGNLLAHLGDPQLGCYLRSGAKPFQALPLFGRAHLLAEYLFSAPEMALMCASHRGEPRHVEAGQTLFAKLGLNPYEVLKNGPDLPESEADIAALLRAGGEPSVLHHNCSGNHAVFLALAKAGGYDLETYQRADHPVQRPVHGLMAALSGQTESDLHVGVDNCGVPAYWMSLTQAAMAFARLANPLATAQLGLPFPFETDVFINGARKVAGAMWTKPEFTAGEGHLNTFICEAGKGRFFGKNGAEGFYGIGVAGAGEYPQITTPPPGASWSTEGRFAGAGLGVAFKIWGGDREYRGMNNTALTALELLELLPAEVVAAQTELRRAVRRTHRGDRELGRTYPVFDKLQTP